MTPKRYLKKIGIEITEEVEKEIKDADDVDCVLDAAYLFKTDIVNMGQYSETKTFRYFYFNGEKPQCCCIISLDVDLSNSLTANYWHYQNAEDALNPVVLVEFKDSTKNCYFEY